MYFVSMAVTFYFLYGFLHNKFKISLFRFNIYLINLNSEMSNYKNIGKNLYRNKRHLYIKKICDYCKSEFFCRKDKTMTKKTCGKECYQTLVEKNNKYEISDYVDEVIVGSLLSDGSIGHTNNGKNYFWTHTCIKEDYIDYLINTTGIHLHKMKINSHKFTSKNGKEYNAKEAFLFKSKASISFTEYRNNWYPNGIKIVPKNIKITPIVLLHWYIGDGFISDTQGITLSTDSFDIDSIDFLLYELSNLDLIPSLNYLKNRITIPNRRVIEFLKYIGLCPVSSFNYKWETFIKSSYIGRICLNCEVVFDALENHQKYCNPRCAINFSNKSGNNLNMLKILNK